MAKNTIIDANKSFSTFIVMNLSQV